MSETIWMYWEGPQPAFISLCAQTVRAHNSNVVTLDRAGFDRLFTEDRDIEIDALALNHKSDFIRAYLLKHYGGLYVDADCIVMRDLSPVLDLARRHEFVGYREPQGYMSCNFMASAAGGAVIREHYSRVAATLRGRRELQWLDLASVPMNAAVAALPGRSHELPTLMVMPLCWSESQQLCVARQDEDHARHFQTDAYCYMLSNNTIRARDQTRILCYMPEAHLLSSRFFISYLFRKAFEQGGA